MGNKNRYASLILLGALIYPFLTGIANSQQLPTALISGRILDQETEKPLDNVIVYLTNTFWGTSTDTLGRFVLSNIEPGEYNLVVSRVGYNRTTKLIQIRNDDSIFYDIKLTSQPVQPGGIDILGKIIEDVKPPLKLLFPSIDEDTYCVYGNSESLPIGIFFTDSILYMYAIDTALVEKEKYIRLWLLTYNLMEHPYMFNPLKCINLNIHGKKTYNNIPPEDIRKSSDKEEAMMVRERVEETIRTLQLFQILIKPGYNRTMRMDQGAKSGTTYDPSGKMEIRWNFQKDPALKGVSTEFISNIYSKCVFDGLLSRHIIYPKNGVHGFLYFPYPGLVWQSTNNKFDEAFENQYILEIQSPTETKTIVFTAH